VYLPAPEPEFLNTVRTLNPHGPVKSKYSQDDLRPNWNSFKLSVPRSPQAKRIRSRLRIACENGIQGCPHAKSICLRKGRESVRYVCTSDSLLKEDCSRKAIYLFQQARHQCVVVSGGQQCLPGCSASCPPRSSHRRWPCTPIHSAHNCSCPPPQTQVCTQLNKPVSVITTLNRTW